MGRVFLNNTVSAWLTAIAVALGVTLALYAVKETVVRRRRALAGRTATTLDDSVVEVLDATRVTTVALIGLFAGSATLDLPPTVDHVALRIVMVAAVVQAGLWGDSALRIWLARPYQSSTGHMTFTPAARTVGFVARMALWTGALLVILDNLGATTLVASLGIGGIAIALAVQNILGDLFASLSIVLDKPFVVGDFLIVDTYEGMVEYVGLRSTRLRSMGGEELVFSNTDLLKSRLRNMTRMDRRRAAFTVAVACDTPTSRLRLIPPLLAAVVKAQEPVTFDRAHFAGMAAAALNFDVVYWVETADFNRYMDIQQEIYLQLMDRFDDLGIGFALPRERSHVDDAQQADTAAPSILAPAPPSSWRSHARLNARRVNSPTLRWRARTAARRHVAH